MGTIRLDRDAPRAASISRVADVLLWNGEEVVEVFEEVSSPAGRAVLPIHLKRGGKHVFVQVETGPWEKKNVEAVLRTAAVLRGSEYADAELEVLGAYPVPKEVRYFCGKTPAALFQLDLVHHDGLNDARACAAAFVEASGRRWGLSLDYDPERLPLIEELLLATLDEERPRRDGSKNGTPAVGALAPVTDALVRGFGCYVGEILRHHVKASGLWCSVTGWGEGLVVEFPNATVDPIGKARAFFENGAEDSVAYYVSYALAELNGNGSSG